MARSIDTDELRAFARELNAAAAKAPDLVEAVVTKGMTDITATAKVSAAVDTGFLRSSIGFDVTRDDQAITGEAGPTAEYGDYVESGTSRMAPQPFMAPSLERHLPSIQTAIAQVAGDALG